MSVLPRILVAAGAAVALAAGAAYWTGALTPSTETTLAALGEHLPQLLQRIRNFHRVVTRDGERVLEISADEASYYKDQRAVVITRPRVVFYDAGERVASVTGLEGRLVIEGNDVEAVRLEGDVALELGRFVLEAGNLNYDHAAGTIEVDGPGRIEAPDLTLAGADLVVDVGKGSLSLGGGVTMRIAPASG